MMTAWARMALAVAALAGAGAAQASMVTYDGTGGTATITATDLTNPSILITLSGNVFNLAPGTGSVVTFDTAVPDLGSFLFTTSGLVTVTAPAAFSGTTINFSSLSLASTGVTPATNLGGGNYQFLNAGATAASMYSVNGGAATSLSGNTTGLTGTVGISGSDTLGLVGITLGTITLKGQQISLKADIAYVGAPVPLPPAVWLLGSGLGLLGVPFIRRRKPAVT